MFANRTASAGILIIIALAGQAAAQQAQQQEETVVERRELRGGFDRPLIEALNTRGRADTVVVMSQTVNGETWTIELRNGEVTKVTQGQTEIPASRVRRQGDRYEILGENGEVLTSLVAPSITSAPPRAPRALALRPGLAATQPRAMLGISMSGSDEHAGGVVVDTVRDGLPAARAGLKVGDVITKIDGKALEGVDDFRARLRESEPGREITLTIIRDGVESQVKVALEAFDPERLGVARLLEVPQASDPQWMTDLSRALDAAMAELHKSDSVANPQKLRAEVEAALARAKEALAAARDEAGQTFQGLQTFRLPENLGQFMARPQGGQEELRFVVPQPPSPPGAAQGDLEAMERRLERMQRSMERVSEQMERMSERLDARLREMEARIEGRNRDGAPSRP
jgi:hypothetical protein